MRQSSILAGRSARAMVAVAAASVVLVAPPWQPDASAAHLDCSLTAFTPGEVNAGGQIDPYFPAATSVQAVMLFLDFSDAPAGAGDAFDDYADRLVPDATWMRDASYGNFTLSITQHRTWLRMPETANHYGMFRDGANRYEEYISDALAVADPGVDFAQADIVFLVPQRDAPNDYSPSHPGVRPTVDGRQLVGAVTFGSDMFYWNDNLLTHETGHLFGLPDLYAYDGGSDFHRFVGGWDVMGFIAGHANDYFAWHKYRLGWLAETDLACVTAQGPTTVTLQPLSRASGTRAAVLPTGDANDRVHVLEYRDGTRLDSGLSCSSGVLVYSVDQTGVDYGEGVIRVVDSTPGSNPQDGAATDGSDVQCVNDLDDAPLTADSGTFSFGPGFSATVESLGDTATVRIERSSGDAPEPQAHDPSAQCDSQQDNQGRFSDVPAGSAHAYTINCIVGYEITTGYTDGTYRPGGTLSRAQTATFLVRMLDLTGVLPAWSGTDHFDDDDGILHEEAINRLADAGIVSTASRSFAPGEATTRSTMAQWTIDALALGGVTTSDTTDWFTDDEQDPNEDEINALTSLGVVTGKGGGLYGPAETLSRGQMATFLARAYSVLVG